MPSAAFVLSRPDGTRSLVLGAKEIGHDTLLEIENRSSRNPYDEVREIASGLVEVGRTKSSLTFRSSAPDLDTLPRVSAETVRDALGKFSAALLDGQYDLRAWLVRSAEDRAVVALVPDVIEERDVATCLLALGFECDGIHRVWGGSYPVIDLEAFDVEATWAEAPSASPAP